MQQQEFRRLAAELKNNLARLMDKRSTWESHWQECADFMQPRKADVTKRRARGDKRMEQVFDSSPIQAVELLAASLHGMLTNPSTPWFTLRFKDEDKKTKLCHSLNGSSLALPRIMAALIENYQNANEIYIPEVLIPYCGFDKI